jgi:uncharacterized RDD family membrane protein YckC
VVGSLVTGEAVALDLPIAGVPTRLLALGIDVAVQVAVTIVLFLLSSLILAALGVSDALVAAIGTVVVVLGFVVWPVTQETLSHGRSLGKLSLGLVVVRDDGGPIRFRHALTRALVGLAVEWPGLLLAGPVGWTVGIATATLNPVGKRLGDLAAGTIVVREHVYLIGRGVPLMPPPLAGWAPMLELTTIDDRLALTIRHFLARNRDLSPVAREELGRRLAEEVAGRVAPPPPPGTPGWAFLSAVLAERRRRETERLVQRSVSYPAGSEST